MGAPDAYSEVCLISITEKGEAIADEVEFAGVSETIDIDLGDKDVEWIPILNGGRVQKISPQADTTVTIDAYPVEATHSGAATERGFWDMMNSSTTDVDLCIGMDRVRDKYRLSILWTDDTSLTTACSAVATDHNANRFIAAEGLITGIKPSYTDGILKFSITMKFPPFDKAGNATIFFESCTDGDTVSNLAVMATYTATTYSR